MSVNLVKSAVVCVVAFVFVGCDQGQPTVTLPDSDPLKKEPLAAELFAIYRAVACIRHTTVHRDGQPSTYSMRKLQRWDKDLVKQLTRPSVLTGEETILPTATAAAVLFEGMAGLGYCLYKTSSDLCEMTVRRPRK